DRFLGFCCLSDCHAASSLLSFKVHCVDALYLCAAEHFLNSLFDLILCRVCVYKECIFLVSHQIHALLCDDRFKDYIIILNVCHYAYTSSIAATAAFVAITVLYFRTSYTLIVFVRAVLTSGMFLAEISTFVFPSSSTTSALFTFRLFRTFWKFFVLISSNLSSSTTMNLFSSTLEVRADLRAALFSFLFILKE